MWINQPELLDHLAKQLFWGTDIHQWPEPEQRWPEEEDEEAVLLREIQQIMESAPTGPPRHDRRAK